MAKKTVEKKDETKEDARADRPNHVEDQFEPPDVDAIFGRVEKALEDAVEACEAHGPVRACEDLDALRKLAKAAAKRPRDDEE